MLPEQYVPLFRSRRAGSIACGSKSLLQLASRRSFPRAEDVRGAHRLNAEGEDGFQQKEVASGGVGETRSAPDLVSLPTPCCLTRKADQRGSVVRLLHTPG